MRKNFWFGLLFGIAACGDSPVAPTPAPVAQTPAPEVKIVAVSNLYINPASYVRKSPNETGYVIDGVGQNVGVGCVSEIVGTTTVRVSGVTTGIAGSLVIQDRTFSWVTPATTIVTPGSQFWYSAKIEFPIDILAPKVDSYTTTFKAKAGC